MQSPPSVTENVEEIRQTVVTREPFVTAIPTPPESSGLRWRIAAILLALLSYLAFASMVYIFWVNPRSAASSIVLGEISVNGPTELCPGEYLDFSFELDVLAPGIYGLDMSVFRVSPPPNIAIFSEKQAFVIGSPRTFLVTRHWQIPKDYRDEQTNEVIAFAPGDYERNIAVGTPGRNTSPSTKILPFSIRSDCETNP
jgi:hypothetical protein